MEEVDRLLSDIQIPQMFRVRQHFVSAELPEEKISKTVAEILSTEPFRKKICPGMRIALTAGSREIFNLDRILCAAVEFLKAQGARPFIVPAMGSHGGGTGEGQLELLAEYHITQENCGCPILSSMETAQVGTTLDGQRVFMDRNAYEADGILVINRVKPHTNFRGDYESGIMKMMAIGLGKQEGAEVCHRRGFQFMAENIREFGHTVLENTNVIGAIAILENACERTAHLIGLQKEEIEEREPILLNCARELMPKILLAECDVLIVDEIGKNFSGTGMDPNVTGRHTTPNSSGGLNVQRIAVLGLSEKTRRNGFGIGAADCTTQRVAGQLDLQAMYVNAMTSTGIRLCAVPCTLKNDRLAIQACMKTSVGLGPEGARIIRISNTLHLQEIMISANCLEQVRKTANMTVIDEPFDLLFDQEGFLQN